MLTVCVEMLTVFVQKADAPFHRLRTDLSKVADRPTDLPTD